jgi:hypothetical protein
VSDRAKVEAMLDVAIANALAKDDSSFEIPDIATEMGSNQKAASALASFLEGRFQDFWLDEVLERVHEFEEPLGTLLDQLDRLASEQGSNRPSQASGSSPAIPEEKPAAEAG